MYKLTYRTANGAEHNTVFNDLFDAQQEARNVEINLGISRENIWISIEY